MADKDWKTLDTAEVVRRQRKQNEQTTSAGVGGYEVPIGQPLRRQVPVPPYEPAPAKKKPKKKS
jgi:hypothetical protein